MSTERQNSYRPDGYLLVKDRLAQKNILWADIVLSCEYKLEDGVDQCRDVSILCEL